MGVIKGFGAPGKPPPPFGNFSTTNIWGKQLSNGSFALLFLNVGPTVSSPLTCDAACVAKLLGAPVPSGTRFRVREIWSKRDLPDAVAPLSMSSPPLETTGIHMIRLWPKRATMKSDDRSLRPTSGSSSEVVQGRLHVDGKPFFVNGLYVDSLAPADWSFIVGSGFNTVLSYTNGNRHLQINSSQASLSGTQVFLDHITKLQPNLKLVS